MKKSLIKLFLIVIFIVVNGVAFAQCPGGPPCGGPNQPPPPGLPVDGGILFLLASGLVYGVVKLRKKE